MIFLAIIIIWFAAITAEPIGCRLEMNVGSSPDVMVTIAKINKHLSLLNYFNKKNKKEHLVQWSAHTSVPFFFDCDVHCQSYKHPLLALGLKKMGVEGSLDPLFETWALFVRQYKDVETELFLQEVTILIFCLYKNILQGISQQSAQRVNIPEVLALYSKITSLPIDEVLTALDHCYIRLVFVLKEYEFFTSMSWTEWLGKYWWLPPVVTLGIVWKIFFYKVVSHLIKPQFYSDSASLSFESYLGS